MNSVKATKQAEGKFITNSVCVNITGLNNYVIIEACALGFETTRRNFLKQSSQFIWLVRGVLCKSFLLHLQVCPTQNIPLLPKLAEQYSKRNVR